MDADEDYGTILIGQTTPVSYFDQVIGYIEDIILSPEFRELQDAFFEKHWQSIECSEENKHSYMDIFQEYSDTFEKFFIDELTRRMPTFDMQNFAFLLNQNEAFTDTSNYSEVFELLHSFSDFQVFKDLVLDYRKKKEGTYKHLEVDILITKPWISSHPCVMESNEENENEVEEGNVPQTKNSAEYFGANAAATSQEIIDITDHFLTH